mgnify:CR=1 FL=1
MKGSLRPRLPRLFRRFPRAARTGSLTRRMIGVSALWILVLLGAGGYTLDRVLTSAITRNFDAQLEYVLTALLASAEVGTEGEAFLNRPLADQRFLEPYSGLYFQISAVANKPPGAPADIDLPSRSLWDRKLKVTNTHNDVGLHIYNSSELEGETLRVVERDIQLPGSPTRWRCSAATPSRCTSACTTRTCRWGSTSRRWPAP